MVDARFLARPSPAAGLRATLGHPTGSAPATVCRRPERDGGWNVSWLNGLQRQRLASERRQELAQQRMAAGREKKRVAWERGFELVNAYAREMEAFLQPDLAELAGSTWGDDTYVYRSSLSKAALPWEGGVMHHTCRWSARKKDAEQLGFEVSV